jgi:hypothetical protein
MGEKRGAYRVLVGRPEGKRPLERPRRRREDNIKWIFRKWHFGGMDWIELGTCDCGNEPSVSIKCGECFD